MFFDLSLSLPLSLSSSLFLSLPLSLSLFSFCSVVIMITVDSENNDLVDRLCTQPCRRRRRRSSQDYIYTAEAGIRLFAGCLTDFSENGVPKRSRGPNIFTGAPAITQKKSL